MFALEEISLMDAAFVPSSEICSPAGISS